MFTARLRADADNHERRRFVDFVSSIVHGMDGTRPPKVSSKHKQEALPAQHIGLLVSTLAGCWLAGSYY